MAEPILVGFDPSPQELIEIQQRWKEKAEAYGDVGSCVIGAGFVFTYKGKQYKMPPISRWQGSCSWEAFNHEVEAELVALGCTDVFYHPGRLD